MTEVIPTLRDISLQMVCNSLRLGRNAAWIPVVASNRCLSPPKYNHQAFGLHYREERVRRSHQMSFHE